MADTVNDGSHAFVLITPRERLRAAASAFGALVILVVGAVLVPDGRGVGTHEQLGLPPCTTYRLFGIPCPFCGMTTAFAHMAHGHPYEAFQTQPAGALAFFGAIGFAVFNGIVAGTARAPAMLKKRSVRRVMWQVGIGVVACAWLYKMAVTL